MRNSIFSGTIKTRNAPLGGVVFLVMSKQQNIEISGEVTQALPNTMFRVMLDSDAPEEFADKEILCTLAGKMRMYRIRVMPGDKVRVEITPYDNSRGRITYRDK